jgi:hypothetical protein
MRRIASFLLLGSLSAALAAGASMTGWISDSTCGASNANGSKESRECAERCIKNGADAVLVTEADGKVYKLVGAAKVTDHMQHKVQVTGEVKGDTITVKEIKRAS